MALAGVLAGLRSGVLRHIRLTPSAVPAVAAPTSLLLFRGFAEGTYLNKDDVTERVVKVVKNFDKVDPGKVYFIGFSFGTPQYPGGLRTLLWVRLPFHVVLSYISLAPDQSVT